MVELKSYWLRILIKWLRLEKVVDINYQQQYERILVELAEATFWWFMQWMVTLGLR